MRLLAIGLLTLLVWQGAILWAEEAKEISFDVYQVYVSGERSILERRADTKANTLIAMVGSYAQVGIANFGTDAQENKIMLDNKNTVVRKTLFTSGIIENRFFRTTYRVSLNSTNATLGNIISLSTNIQTEVLPLKYAEFEREMTRIQNELILEAVKKTVESKLPKPYPATVSAKVYFTDIPIFTIQNSILGIKMKLDVVLEN